MRSRFSLWTILAGCVLLTSVSQGIGADPPKFVPFEEAHARDLAQWRTLFADGDYESLEKIADDLRKTKAKYSSGRGRLWRFCALTAPERKEDGDYQAALKSLDKWLSAHPKSINVRLLLAKQWFDYAFFARGRGTVDITSDEQLKVFAERSKTAAKYLTEIEGLATDLDNVYRRLRIEVSKGLGEKPDVEMVYDGLKADPLDMEIVHGMSICLLPRWFGEEGELEKFADEVVRRTKDHCGQMQYTTAAIATKEFLKAYTLDTHEFAWPRLRQGFRDLEKLYPGSTEHLNDEAQFAFMAEDLDVLYDLIARIGDHPVAESWRITEIRYDELRKRIKPDMLKGDQKRLLLGNTRPVLSVDPIADGKYAVCADWDFMLRLYDVVAGKGKGWFRLDGINGSTVRAHPNGGLIATAMDEGPGILFYGPANGRTAGLSPSESRVRCLEFSPKGDLLACADESGLVVVFDLKTGKPKHSFPSEAKRELTGVAFSSDGERLAASCGSGELLVFDLKSDKLETTRKLSEHPLHSIAWSKRGLAVGSAQGEVKLLDEPASKNVTTWKDKPLDVATLMFSPDGEQLAIGLRHPIGPRQDQNWDTPVEAPLWLWKHRTEKTPQSLKGHQMGVNRVSFADGGKALLSASHDWTVRVWDVK